MWPQERADEEGLCTIGDGTGRDGTLGSRCMMSIVCLFALTLMVYCPILDSSSNELWK